MYASRSAMSAPSERDPRFDLASAYAVESGFVRMRRASGRATVGRKVGFANKAMWRVLKLDTLVAAHDRRATRQGCQQRPGIGLDRRGRVPHPRRARVVFKLKQPLAAGGLDAAAVLDAVEWLALGFEIIDCVFPDWKFTPADFVAAFGLHAALIVGEPMYVDASEISTLVDQLARFKVRLMKNGELMEEGSGNNLLRSPALCLGELAAGIVRQADAEALATGELVSSGTLTTSLLIVPGETWSAEVVGIGLSSLTLRVLG